MALFGSFGLTWHNQCSCQREQYSQRLDAGDFSSYTRPKGRTPQKRKPYLRGYKALICYSWFGTAEAVPFVQSFLSPLKSLADGSAVLFGS
jgi:hypothetical protein